MQESFSWSLWKNDMGGLSGPMSHLSSGPIPLPSLMKWPNSPTHWVLPQHMDIYNKDFFFPVENFYNNKIILCVHVKFLSLSVFFLSPGLSSRLNTSRLLTSFSPWGKTCLCGEDAERGLTSSGLDALYDPRQINHFLCSSPWLPEHLAISLLRRVTQG